jgi:phage terminase large subunit
MGRAANGIGSLMNKDRLRTSDVFKPLYQPMRYKGAWGGRGSGKSHFFASLAVEEHNNNPGRHTVCIREIQQSLKESAKRTIERQMALHGLTEADGFRSYSDRIATPGDGQIIFLGMQDHTAESLKSLEGYHCAWVEQAEMLSQKSLDILRPTIREPNSELWFSWNPRRRVDPVDVFFRQGEMPANAVCVMANWRDNLWWNKTLEAERLECLNNQPEQYDHIWEGDYQKIIAGAYYAQSLTMAKGSGRISKCYADPLLPLKAFWDIGGTGARADHTVIWIAQFVGREIRVLDYYEAQSQPLATHVQWLRKQGYEHALMVLPHDGAAHDKVHSVSYETELQRAQFETQIIPNQGRAAAAQRIEATRRLFPRIWFHQPTTQDGIDALGSYHAKRDENRLIDLGPEHDWASHAADAFGMMCVMYEEPQASGRSRPYRRDSSGKSWLSM